MTARRTPFADLRPSSQAGILCGDPAFRRYVARMIGAGEEPDTAEAAAEYLRRVCKVTSRRHLNFNADAQARLAALRTDFDAWRGKIPAPGYHGPADTGGLS